MALLQDRVTLISGQSGVGKSTLINSIVEGLELAHGRAERARPVKGQHTTTFAEMHALPFGGQLIDTPGIKTLSFNFSGAE
jgi:ribosome biogenesis GTPase